jgi:hypothetical protein
MNREKLISLGTKGLRVVSKVADVAVHLRADSGPLGWLSVAAKVGDALMESAESEPFRGWAQVSGISPLAEFSLMTAKREGLLRVQPRKQTRVLTGTVNGVCMGWVEWPQWVDGPYIPPEASNEDAVAALRLLLWSTAGKSIKFVQPPLGASHLTGDSLIETHPSQTAVNLWERQRPYVEKGVRRSLLLAGEQGTGKSNIVRHVADMAGGHRLRIKALDLANLRSLAGLCRFLCPDAVVIDDIDRAERPGAIIDEIDEILATSKLVAVTANWVDKLDPAIVRRFDDFEQIRELDAEVLDRLLEGVPASIAGVLRRLPVKYIHAYRQSVEVLGHELAAAEVPRLVAQYELVSRMNAAASAAPTAATKPVGPP